ncbi:MAG: hypothetical protein IKR52_08425 [Paludibacteraceae bacterium]|nr:hypothetical protein [Paludibacteraceae bacterium]
MRKILFVLIATLLWTTQTNAADDYAYIDFSNGETVVSGVTTTMNTGGETDGATFRTVDGVTGINQVSNRYIYFRVSDEIINSTDNALYLEITYYDETSNYILLEYASQSSSYTKKYINRYERGKWMTTIVRLTDAKFNHSQNNASDFRIVSSTGFTISKITIKKELDIYADFTSGTYDLHNIEVPENHTDRTRDHYSEITEVDGVKGISIDHGFYIYCRVAPDAIDPATDKKIAIDITYYDQSTTSIWVQYNADDGQNYTKVDAPCEHSNTWRTVTMYIDNAYFHRAQIYQADFRVSSTGGAIISKIVVRRNHLIPESESKIKLTRNTNVSEFKGKSFVGYQGWYDIGTRYNSWNHYAAGNAEADGTAWPRAGHISIDYFPNVSEFAESSVAQTGFANLGSGKPTKLYKSNTEDVFDVHFGWMEEYGIDGVAVQRFLSSVHTSLQSETSTNFYKRIITAAENHNRLFYIMYDISGGTSISDPEDQTSISPFVKKMEFDWVENIEKHLELTKSTAYATVNGKPVVCLYGFGIPNRPSRIVDYIELINFFHDRNCYIIIGTAAAWRDQTQYIDVFHTADMISPWLVGAFATMNAVENSYNNRLSLDVADCRAHGMDFYPVLYSGFSWAVWAKGKPNATPRSAGQFFWKQAYKLKSTLGLDAFFIAVFDEFDEGTAIAKNASDYFDIPTDQYFVTASCDGYWLSSDFQLRTVGEAIKMAKGTIALTENCPVQHSLGPIYYRNSFESRYLDAPEPKYAGYYPIDPCFKNPETLNNTNVTDAVCEIQQENVKTGNYSITFSGTTNTEEPAIFEYKIADVVIPIKSNMKISFWKNTTNDLAQYSSIDFVTAKGQRLSSRCVDQNNTRMSAETGRGHVGNGWEQYSSEFGTELEGDTITSLIVSYSHAGDGNFTAYFDDIIIEEGIVLPTQVSSPLANSSRSVSAENGNIILCGYTGIKNVEIFNGLGQKIAHESTSGNTVKQPAGDGVVIVNVTDSQNADTYKIILK